jgi:hypothetical protein
MSLDRGRSSSRPALGLRPRWRAPHPRSVLHRALRLAHSISARSTVLSRGFMPVTLVDRRTPPSTPPVALTAQQQPVRGAPQLVAPGLSAPEPARSAPGKPHAGDAAPAFPQAPRGVLETVQRIAHQHLRTETDQRYGLADLAPARKAPDVVPAPRRRPLPLSGPEPAQPPALQVLRPASVVAAAPAAAPEAAPAQAARRDGLAAAVQLPPSPLEMNRLTDQVLQAIDRRIIASRERLGRL